MNTDSAPGKELTLRGLALGVALTLLFCAANIYLGLKIVRAAEADLGKGAVNPAQKKLLEEMVEKRGRFGRKNGKGFYD